MIDTDIYNKYKSGEEPRANDLCWHIMANSYVLVDAVVQDADKYNILVEIVSGKYKGIKGFTDPSSLMLMRRNGLDWLSWL